MTDLVYVRRHRRTRPPNVDRKVPLYAGNLSGVVRGTHEKSELATIRAMRRQASHLHTEGKLEAGALKSDVLDRVITPDERVRRISGVVILMRQSKAVETLADERTQQLREAVEARRRRKQ
mgnify:CR=1 FL=1